MTINLCIPVVLVLLLAACNADQESRHVLLDEAVDTDQVQELSLREREGWVFGFDLRSSPQEDARQYLPFLAYLERSTGEKFHLRFTPQNGHIIDELGSNNVQFAAIGATSYIKARQKYKVGILARGLNPENRAQYRSFIVVHPDSDIGSLGELRGKRFAFGDINSTQGHLIPRIVLQAAGIGLDRLAEHRFTGSHLNCANAVVSGNSDACGLQDTMAKTMTREGRLRILHRSDYYPSSGIAFHRDMDQTVVAKVKQALLDFDPAKTHNPPLYNWSETEMPNGFSAAADEDYRALEQWMIRLGFITQAPGG